MSEHEQRAKKHFDGVEQLAKDALAAGKRIGRLDGMVFGMFLGVAIAEGVRYLLS